MQIISHRGYWNIEEEKNTITAFERSFTLGFGTETDIRDYKGDLVVSHDIPSETALSCDNFFQIYSSYKNPLPLALNIKADGLQLKLKELLQKYNIENYFVFDMSVPDGLAYLRLKLKVFTRHSEYEREPSCYDDAEGVWLDEFYSHWIDRETIIKHLNNNKKVCIVSPELHSREYKKVWVDYRSIGNELKTNAIMLCTDFPEDARRYFYE